MSARARSLRCLVPRWPWRLTERNAAPVVMPETASQRRHARTGQVAGWLPYGRPRMAPSASWSVLDLRKTSRRPVSSSLTSSTSRATSQLAATQRTSEAEQQKRSIPHVGQAVADLHARLDSVFGRSLRTRPLTDVPPDRAEPVFLFAHETLRELADQELGS